jgi:aminoglycoside phosphotransferase (APT) family kinase protein
LPDPALARVAGAVEQNGILRAVRHLTGGLSAGMTALDIEVRGGTIRRVVLRRPSAGVLASRSEAALHEFQLLGTLFQEPLPVPEPLLLDRSETILPGPYLVLSYIEGQADYAPAQPRAFAREAAAMLARIHAVGPSVPGLPALRHSSHAFAGQLRDREPAPGGPIDERVIRRALDPFWSATSFNPAVLLHGDFWPGNLLWHGGTLAGVVDWEDARIGDPLADLAISRLDSCLILGPDAMHELTTAYASHTSVDIALLPYWDLAAALRAAPALAEWATGFPALGRPDLTKQRLQERLSQFVTEALADL